MVVHLSHKLCLFLSLLWCVTVRLRVLFFVSGGSVLVDSHCAFPLRKDGEEGVLPAALLQVCQDDLKHCRKEKNGRLLNQFALLLNTTLV